MVECTDTCTIWRNAKTGNFERLGGPALEFTNGNKEWYRANRLHREDGPAIDYADRKEWWLAGERYTEYGFIAEMKARQKKFDKSYLTD